MSWVIASEKAKAILQHSVPKQWLLPPDKLPPASQKNVIDIPKRSGLLTDRELDITEMSASALVAGMGAGQLSAEEVVVAFLKRAVIGHQLLNFATEFIADDAISKAKELDAYFKKTGKLIGPLHGVPISIKEHIGVKGHTLNAGYTTWVDHIASEDALILQILSKAGAVFHVRTNQPQSLMHLCCTNNLTGTTVNPHNRTLSPGGSSGGEGASMGFKCAPLGIGTDIGGSIRAPAAFCGAYGFRPTAKRNPTTGLKSPAPGQEAILGVVGPLAANSLSDLELFQRTLLAAEPWEIETSLVPVPWKKVDIGRKFTVGILWEDGIVRPHPPITRALKHAKTQLQKAGIKVVDWEPYKHSHGWDIISKLYFPDAAQSQKALLSQTTEPTHPLTTWAFTRGSPSPLSIHETWALNTVRDIYRDEHAALMKQRGVDFILCPSYPGVAPGIGEAQYWLYTAIWNILDLPAVIFPSGMVVEERDLEEKMGESRGDVDDREWRKWEGDPRRYLGAPVGLQVVGGHFRDEEVIAAAGVIEVVCGENSRRAVL
ncbi:amidase [Aspergillus avenaceus]|uniref:amidase n=1 Tax=Aspergillus avenaceus TaxID=36643 RepID=A0A5N6TQJ2_ASPAV|nr:amidase [Aspergillus avenaceus]